MGDNMKFIFLGTGAADWPIQKREDMSEFRRLSSALIDDTLLIDPGPQVFTMLIIPLLTLWEQVVATVTIWYVRLDL